MAHQSDGLVAILNLSFAQQARRGFRGGLLFILCLALLPLHLAAAAPRRIVSLSPNITESIFALGGGNLLVGVTDFCTYPPEARKLRHCGAWAGTNYEALDDLRPDLIVVLGQHQSVRKFGAERGFPVAGVTMDSERTILTGLRELGRLISREDAATSLTAHIEAQLAQLKKERDATPPHHRPTVFISIGRRPGSLAGIHTATGGSFLDEALALAGGRNVFGDIKSYYPQASKESLVVRRPEVILEITMSEEMTPQQKRQLVTDWAGLPSIPAVQSGRIYVLSGDYLLVPGPRLPQTVRTFRSALYPPKLTLPRSGR